MDCRILYICVVYPHTCLYDIRIKQRLLVGDKHRLLPVAYSPIELSAEIVFFSTKSFHSIDTALSNDNLTSALQQADPINFGNVYIISAIITKGTGSVNVKSSNDSTSFVAFLTLPTIIAVGSVGVIFVCLVFYFLYYIRKLKRKSKIVPINPNSSVSTTIITSSYDQNCWKCRAVLAASDRFCGNCGSEQNINCPVCQLPRQLGKKFCTKCGTSYDVSLITPVRIIT